MSEKTVINRLLIVLLPAMVSFSEAIAGATDLLPEVQRLSLPLSGQLMRICEDNPSAMLLRDSVSLSSFSVRGDFERQEKAIVGQDGDGHSLFSLSADTYTRLGGDCVVWGSAEFITGTYHSVRWSDCIDYDRVAPYVLGDEVGGDLSTRSYRFSGGYARRFRLWNVGVEAAYRAEIAYRSRDPRVKTVVSDLDISIGAGLEVCRNKIIGLTAGLNIYNQSCDIDFYNPLNETNTYPLTGLGTCYNRFIGNANKGSGHSSLGYKLGLQWLSVDRRGISATLDFSTYRMDQTLRSFSNLTLGYTDNSMLDLNIFYRWCLTPRLVVQPGIDGSVSQRKGTENLFGTSAGSNYNKIGKLTPYSRDIRRLRLSVPVQIAGASRATYLTLVPEFVYDDFDESYSDPRREVYVSYISPGLNVNFSTLTGKRWMLECSLAGSYIKSKTEDFAMTDLDPTSALGGCVMSNYSMLASNRRCFSASAGFSLPADKIILSFNISYKLTDFKDNGVCHGAWLSLTARF